MLLYSLQGLGSDDPTKVAQENPVDGPAALVQEHHATQVSYCSFLSKYVTFEFHIVTNVSRALYFSRIVAITLDKQKL